MRYECNICGHVYGTEWPSQPVVQLHHTVSHDTPEDKRVWSI